MLSVAITREELTPHLTDDLDVAAENAPKHCVVSGPAELITQLEKKLTSQWIPSRQLRTSHAFHSRMMDPMLDAFAQLAGSVTRRKPTLPYVSNVSGGLAVEEELQNPKYWAEQIRRPVQFARGVETLLAQGATLFIQVGPGKTLCTLARQCGVETRGGSVVDTLPDARAAGNELFTLNKVVARSWLSGAAVDGSLLYAGEQRRRVPLPGYAFERQRYWRDFEGMQQGRPQSNSEKRKSVADWLYTPSWRRTERFGTVAGDQTAREVLVFCDALGLGSRVAAALRAAGDQVSTVEIGDGFAAREGDSFAINPALDEDYDKLLAALSAAGRLPTHVVHGWSLGCAPAPLEVEGFRRDQVLGLYSLLRLLKSFESRERKAGRLHFHVLSHGLFDVTGEDRLAPQNNSLLAFTKVTPQEHEELATRLFDLELPSSSDGLPSSDALDALASQLAAELRVESAERVVAVRNGYRWIPRFDLVEASALMEKAPLKERGVYLITGGLGKIGLTLAQHLVRRYQASVILVGRSAPIDRAEWPKELLELDGAVTVLRADVSNEAEMRGVRAQVEEKHGRVDGIIFAAGRTTLARSAFQDTGVAECEDHFISKAFGVMVLERVWSDAPLDFCMLLSSLSVVLGGLGHMAYSAANHVCDALIARRNRTSAHRWLTVDWDAWLFGTDDDVIRALSRLSMLPAEGVETFELALRVRDATTLVVSTADLKTRIDQWIVQRSGAGQPAEARPLTVYARPQLETPYAEPEGDLEKLLAGIWQNALGVDRVGRDDDFFQLGGHSLMAIQILSQVRKTFVIDMPIDRAFEATSVRKAAAILDELLTAKVSSLSDEEAERLLKQSQQQ